MGDAPDYTQEGIEELKKAKQKYSNKIIELYDDYGIIINE